jgi:hypothetical protein
VRVSPHSQGIEPRSRRGPSWRTKETLGWSGLGWVLVYLCRGEEGGLGESAPGVNECPLMGGRGQRTVVFKPLGPRDAATSSGVAEASFQVRLQTHPGQRYRKGRTHRRSPTPTARPQPTTAKPTNLEVDDKAIAQALCLPSTSNWSLSCLDTMLGPQSSDDLPLLYHQLP